MKDKLLNLFKDKKTFKRPQAQTILELAVFGAVVIFMLGVIIRQAFLFNINQNANLRGVRQAMLLSFQNAWGFENTIIRENPINPDNENLQRTQGNQSRNTASIVIVEDRLSPDSSKYGSMDRSPLTINTAAVNTRNLFNQIDYGDSFDLPRVDFFVNGARFPFTVANFKRVRVDYARPENQTPPLSPLEWQENCMDIYCDSDCTHPPPCEEEANERCNPLCSNCSSTHFETIGCPVYFKVIPNHPRNREWCSGDDTDGAPSAGECTYVEQDSQGRRINEELDHGWSASRRFDLGRDGSVDEAQENDVPEELRPDFTWQWGRVLPYFDGFERLHVGTGGPSSGQYVVDGHQYLLPGDTTSLEAVTIHAGVCPDPGEPIFGAPEPNPPDTCNHDTMRDLKDVSDDLGTQLTLRNVRVDIDGDFKPEDILALSHDSTGRITYLYVVDAQDGDLNFTNETRDAQRPNYVVPGFTYDMQMFTRFNDGTVLAIDEGRLFTPETHQFVRNVQQRDHVDLIQRVLRLSNNTGRFCSTIASRDDIPVRRLTVDGLPNPVAVCCNEDANGSTGGCNDGTAGSGTSCFHDRNLERTCMEVKRNIIYVRSRVLDRFGHKWVTDVTQDFRTNARPPSDAPLFESPPGP